MKKYLKYIPYIFMQCTWGVVQTLAGLTLFCCTRSEEHVFYHGCIWTKWRKRSGISLGLFVFAPDETNQPNRGKMVVHEYGHTIQSLLLGPLYLPVVGSVSFVWCNLPYFRRIRQERQISYTYCFIES